MRPHIPLPYTLVHHWACLADGLEDPSTAQTAEWSVYMTTECPLRYAWILQMAHTTTSISQLVDCITLFCQRESTTCVCHRVSLVVILQLGHYSPKPHDTGISSQNESSFKAWLSRHRSRGESLLQCVSEVLVVCGPLENCPLLSEIVKWPCHLCDMWNKLTVV